MFSTITSSGRRGLLRFVFGCCLLVDNRTIGRTHGHAIINDWRISMVKSIMGNRATGSRPSGSNRQPIIRSIWATDVRL